MSETTVSLDPNPVDKSARPFGWRDKFGYLMGDFGCNMSFSLISGYMLLFFTQYVGISLIHYSAIILITKIFDGINDPIVGALVDKLKPKKGDKFRPWILWGSIPLSLSAAIMFIDSAGWPYWAKILICVGSYVIWDICYTLVNVPYGSMSSVISANTIERSQLSTYRSFGAVVAGIPLGILLPMFTYKKEIVNGVEKSVFQGQMMFPIAVILGVVAFISFMILYKWSVERIKHTDTAEEKFNYFRMLKNFATNRAVLGISLAALSQTVFIMSAMQLGQMTFQMYFGDGSLNSLSVLSYLIPMAVGAPLIKGLVKRFGKKEISTLPLLGTIIIYILMLIMPITNPYIWIGLQILAATFGAGNLLLNWAMISDAIDYMELKTGRREEGSIYATYSMIRKIGQGIGQALVPALIAFVIPGLLLNDASTWSAEYAAQIKNMSIMFPLVGNILIFISFAFIYNLDKKAVADMQVSLGRAEKGE